MMNLCQLLSKYSEFKEVNDDLFVYLDRLLENAFEIHNRTKVVTAELQRLELQLTARKQSGKVSSPASSPVKKRKIRSTESSFCARKENVSAVDDSHIFPYKSDPESSVCGSSVLEQNIIADSEESFFACSQSPHKKEALSVSSEASRNNVSNRVKSPVVAVKISPPQGKGKWEGNLLRKSVLSSVAGASSLDEIGPAASSSPTMASSKWTSKKFPIDKTIAPKQEHTPVSVKRFFSLCESPNRLRQTKLAFTESSANHASTKKEVSEKPIEDDSWMIDFVVPTPPSTGHKNKSTRNWKNRKQSTMVTKEDNSATVNKCGLSLTGDAIKAKAANISECRREDDLADIDRTFCAGAESNSKQSSSNVTTKIKQEPPSQVAQTTGSSDSRKPNNDNLLPNAISNEADISEIELVQPSSQESIISVKDSQPSNDNLAALKEQHGLHNQTSEISCTAPNNFKTGIWDNPPKEVAQLKRSKSEQPSSDPLCVDCKKLFKFHVNCGRPVETVRSKLPKNCRSCRMLQLHHTPPDFWNPDFLPSQ
ncbi:Papilin [Anopheles darlingi]|uniref:Papilin n=1 Tax=Anopheles darlingi TaxID=43151 RepID=W5JM90_ANODA|nr:Papilin [Anopheles darlingi]